MLKEKPKKKKKRIKRSPEKIAADFVSLSQEKKRVEDALSRTKAELEGLKDNDWNISKNGSLFLWDEQLEGGVTYIKSEAKNVLNEDKAVRFCIRNGHKRALRRVLDKDVFKELIEDGTITPKALKKLTEPGKPLTYVRYTDRRPPYNED